MILFLINGAIIFLWVGSFNNIRRWKHPRCLAPFASHNLVVKYCPCYFWKTTWASPSPSTAIAQAIVHTHPDSSVSLPNLPASSLSAL